jgi:hypothetical protein
MSTASQLARTTATAPTSITNARHPVRTPHVHPRPSTTETVDALNTSDPKEAREVLTKVVSRLTLFGGLPPSILPMLVSVRTRVDLPKTADRKLLRVVTYLIQLASGEGAAGTAVPFSTLLGARCCVRARACVWGLCCARGAPGSGAPHASAFAGARPCCRAAAAAPAPTHGSLAAAVSMRPHARRPVAAAVCHRRV